VAVLPDERILAAIAEIRTPLEALASSFAYGRIVHDGLTLAIVGRPNVGKSSLFNRLVERERAIVTAVPGTTRDLVTETVSLSGIPIRLIDTAGIRAASNEAEEIGIRKSYEALADADIVLIVTDNTSAQHANEEQRLLGASEGRKRILVRNKADLSSATEFLAGKNHLPEIRTSAISGEGIDDLRERIVTEAGGSSRGQQESGLVTNLRQRKLVEESLAALSAAENAVQNRVPHEMLLMDLHAAVESLDVLTGQTTTEDILNLIFSTFCIGK
jgi:tRNA modification GTPase